MIVEEQLKKLQESDDDLQKTKALVLSMHDEGMDINDIEKYTNLPLQALIFLLKDHVKVDINDTLPVLGSRFPPYSKSCKFVSDKFFVLKRRIFSANVCFIISLKF